MHRAALYAVLSPQHYELLTFLKDTADTAVHGATVDLPGLLQQLENPNDSEEDATMKRDLANMLNSFCAVPLTHNPLV